MWCERQGGQLMTVWKTYTRGAAPAQVRAGTGRPPTDSTSTLTGAAEVGVGEPGGDADGGSHPRVGHAVCGAAWVGGTGDVLEPGPAGRSSGAGDPQRRQ